MSYGKAEQEESYRFWMNVEKPWRMRRKSTCRKFLKKSANRHERQRAKYDIEGISEHKKYYGYEY